MSPEQKEARIKRLVSSARAVLSGQVGITVGVFRIRNNIDWIDRDMNKEYPVFKEYENKIPTDVPVGSARLMWNPESLMKTDLVLKKMEYKYRDKVFLACIQIIKKFAGVRNAN